MRWRMRARTAPCSATYWCTQICPETTFDGQRQVAQASTAVDATVSTSADLQGWRSAKHPWLRHTSCR